MKVNSLQEPEAEGGEHEHDADIRDEPLPEVILEEQHVHDDDNDYQDADDEQYRFGHAISIRPRRLLSFQEEIEPGHEKELREERSGKPFRTARRNAQI